MRVLRRSIRALAASALLCALATPAEARDCVDVGCMIPDFGLVLPVALVAAVGVTADVYYTPKILGNAFDGTEPSRAVAGHEVAWTSWQSAIFLVAAGATSSSESGTAEATLPLLAFGTWPLAITAHGTWYAAPDTPLVRYPVAGTLGAADGALLAYDIVGFASSRRVSTVYSVVETGSGLLESVYGVAWSTHEHGAARSRTLALSAAPVLLTLHGIATLIGLQPGRPEPPPTDLRRLAITPLVLPRSDGMELAIAGRW